VATVLAGRDRKANAATASPDGLYLAAVRYPAEFGLPGAPPGGDTGILVQSVIIGRSSD
jgi:tRNA pseudouridine38-40 synthase